MNRASQGAYPVRELLLPFLIAQDMSILDKDIPDTSEAMWECAVGAGIPQSWPQALSRGCELALNISADGFNGSYIADVISNFGLDAEIDIGLPINTPQILDEGSGWQGILKGEGQARLSPLQLAYAASTFSNQGTQATPQILSAVDTYRQGWVITAQEETNQVLSAQTANDINGLLASSKITGWEFSAQTEDENSHYSWYLAGTPAHWTSTPIVMVLVTENSSTKDLQKIGQRLFMEIIKS